MPSSDVPDMSPTYTAHGMCVMSTGRRRSPPIDAPDHAAARIEPALGLVAIDAERVHHDRELHRAAGALEQRARVVARRRPHTSITMRSLRSTSFTLVARRSTIRLPNVLPMRIIAPVVIVLRISFVAVPALRRVLPVTTSGPVTATIAMSAAASVFGRRRRAGDDRRARADRARVLERAAHVRRGARRGDADDDVARAHAARVEIDARLLQAVLGAFLRARERRGPPAMIPCTISGSVPNVGGHSDASSTPSRPDVPAPT